MRIEGVCRLMPWGTVILLAFLYSPEGFAAERTHVTVGYATDENCAVSFSEDKFARDNESVSIQVLPRVRDRLRAFQTPLTTNLMELPDIVTLFVGPLSDDLKRLADLGLLEPLDPLLEEIGVRPADFLHNCAEAVTYKGQTWALPCKADLLFLAYNKRIFEAGNMQPEFESWEGLFRGVAALNDTEVVGMQLLDLDLFGPTFWLATILGSIGTEFNPLDTELLVSPAAVEVIQMLNKAKESGCLEWGLEPFPLREDIAVGVFTSYFATSNDVFGILDFPTKLNDGGTRTSPVTARIPGYLECFALRRNSTEKLQAAGKFLKWFYSDPVQLDLVTSSDLQLSTAQRTISTVHVPLLKRVYQFPEIQDRLARSKDFSNLASIYRKLYFPTRSDPEAEFLYNNAVDTILKNSASSQSAREVLLQAKGHVEQNVAPKNGTDRTYSEY